MWKWFNRGLVCLFLVLAAASMYAHFTTTVNMRRNFISPFTVMKLQPIGYYTLDKHISFYLSEKLNRSVFLMLGLHKHEVYDLKLCTAIVQVEVQGRNLLSPQFHRVYTVRFYYWQAAILSAIYPTIFLVAWPVRLYRRRHLSDCCWQCDYDLTGNESGICPECGKAINRPTNTEVSG